MKNRFLYLLSLLIVVLLQACSDDINLEDNGTGDVPFDSSMVLFSAGNTENAVTRASIPYMELDGRFVCKMYYHSKTDDTDTNPFDVALPEDHGTHITAWLKVNNHVGNCIYWNSEYTDVSADKQNDYGEKAAQAFYWQNRLTHAFLAVADFNQLKTNTESNGLTMPFDDYVREVTLNSSHTVDTPYKYIFDDGAEFETLAALQTYYVERIKDDDTYEEQNTQGTGSEPTALAPDGHYYRLTNWMTFHYDETHTFLYQIKYRVTVEKEKVKYYAKHYDLTKGTKTGMAQQPDPIQALTLKKPEGATQEANRVRLYFKHQFSQIQVNIKNSEDVSDIPVDASNILSVELLGVTRKGYVYVNLNADGTVHPTDFEQVNEKTIPADQWKEPYGTEFAMFDRTSQLTETERGLGYIKSHEAIAFGRLEGIRIKWKEDDASGGTTHNVIFQIPDDNLKTLQSGVRYIYNLELRRGTLALIRTIIKDWQVDETDYSTDGTISPIKP